MTACWDLRDILRINPGLESFSCAINESPFDLSRKCQNSVEWDDRQVMERIIDAIDMSMVHEDILKGIEELAYRARCNYHQNNASKQNPSLVNLLSSEWTLLFHQRWLAVRKENASMAADGEMLRKMQETLDQMRKMVDEGKDDEMSLGGSTVSYVTVRRLSLDTSSLPAEALPTEDTTSTRVDVPPFARGTFGNYSGNCAQIPTMLFTQASQRRESTQSLDCKFDRRPSLRLLIQSVLLPSPPQTLLRSQSPILQEGALDFMSSESFFGSYYEEASPASSTQANNFHSKPTINIEVQPTSHRLSLDMDVSPPIPPKSPRRPKLPNPSQSEYDTNVLSLPSTPPSPISPISNPTHHHSQNSSCSSMSASFIPSRNSSILPTTTSFKPFTFTIPDYSNLQATNSSTPKISSPTPTLPHSSQKHPQFLDESYSHDNYDHFSASLNLTPYAISYESLKSPSFLPYASSLCSRTVSPFSLTRYDQGASFEAPSVRYRQTGLRSELNNGIEVCTVCRLARNAGTCECQWTDSDSGHEEEKVAGVKKRCLGVSSWVKRTFTWRGGKRKERGATTRGDMRASGKSLLRVKVLRVIF